MGRSRGDTAASDGGERALLRETIREFVASEVQPLILDCEREERFPVELVPRLRDLGFLGGVIPERLGGSGLSYSDFVVVVEELARPWQALGSLVGMPSGPVGRALLDYGTEAQQERFLVPLATGNVLAGFALTEPDAGTDVASIRTVARRVEGGYVLDGRKTWIDWAPTGDYFVVLTKTDVDAGVAGTTAFIVERGTAGFSTTTQAGKLGMRALSVGDLVFDQCFVPLENRLGDEGKGFRVVMAGLEDARLAVAARLCGGLRGCLAEVVAYATDRYVFGQPLGRFQLSQTKITDMVLATESATLLTYEAARLKDEGREATLAVMVAKLFAQEQFMKAAHDGVQLFGSYGVSDEYPVNRFFRDAKVSEITGGTNEILRILIAEQVTGLR